MTRTLLDAAGRTVHVGDTVGGITVKPGQFTVTGEVREVGQHRVLVSVLTAAPPGKKTPQTGDPVWLPARTLFLIYGRAIQGQQVRTVAGPITTMRWSGDPNDIEEAATFVGRRLVGAIVGTDGTALLIRLHKHKPTPQICPPGYFLLHPPDHRVMRICTPEHFNTAYAPLAPADTPD
jgi:hypothetical protein